MAREIQNIFECECYTPNQNLNKTCQNNARCVIHQDEYCYKFKKKYPRLPKS